MTLALAAACLLVSSCTQIQRPVAEPFVAVTQPPAKQDFRWSNGRLPRSFDPARAAAAPETDIVTAIYEGLTDIDPLTGDAVPALAEKWSSDGDKIWTFTLRKDARWSNGKRITTEDVISSWKRLPALGQKAAHREMFHNIVGLQSVEKGEPKVDDQTISDLGLPNSLRYQAQPSPTPQREAKKAETPERPEAPPAKPQGLVAVSDLVLKVTLDIPDKDFPKLVAAPIFRPIYGDGKEFEDDPLDADVVTSGPFTIAGVDKDGVNFERADSYWNRSAIGLESVRMVAKESAEAALDAYKNGELDAVTNADFEPLALKLLTPYEDFRRATHSALNFYQFNTSVYPYSDRRIREALAISIDRERLADVEMEGTSEPAVKMLPNGQKAAPLVYDAAKARDILDKVGFPGGQSFPAIRLVVNRNDTQLRVARAVARMWKQNLNIETTLIVKEPGEMETAFVTGDFDIIRRGAVLPSTDEYVGLKTILGNAIKTVRASEPAPADPKAVKGGPSSAEPEAEPPPMRIALTEEDALFEMNVIPLYFPLSYSLVKPYVQGFRLDGNGSPDLRQVSIDSAWHPKAATPQQ